MLRLNIFAPGASGVPSTAQPLVDPTERITAYEHTITVTGGFETCRVTFPGTLEDALYWCNQMMASLIVTGPDAQVCWEGYLSTVDMTIGQEKISVSLDPMANRVRARYTTVNGVNGVTGNSSSAASQALHGVKEAVLSLPATTLAGAQQLRDAQLALTAYPVANTSGTAGSGEAGQIEVALTFAGWYQALGWLYASNATTSTAVTTAQVTSLISTYNSTNAFFSTDTSQVTASGTSDTQYIPADQMTYKDAVDRLLKQSNASGQRQAWGIYESRRLTVATWAGATPNTVTYYRSLSEGVIRDAAGGLVPAWDVRPNAMYAVLELQDPSPASVQQDAVARRFIERVTCTIGGGQIVVTLEPSQESDLSARLARLERVQYA